VGAPPGTTGPLRRRRPQSSADASRGAEWHGTEWHGAETAARGPRPAAPCAGAAGRGSAGGAGPPPGPRRRHPTPRADGEVRRMLSANALHSSATLPGTARAPAPRAPPPPPPSPSPRAPPPPPGPASVLDDPRSLALGALAFGLVAWDVAGPSSLHLLRSVDLGVHGWVVAHVPPEIRAGAMDGAVSNTAVVVSYVGLGTCMVLGGVLELPEASVRLAALLTVLSQTSSLTIWAKDPGLQGALKQAFHRARPSDLHRSYSFPSGHVSTAAVVCGAFLLFALPFAAEALGRAAGRADAGPGGAAPPPRGAGAPPAPGFVAASVVGTEGPPPPGAPAREGAAALLAEGRARAVLALSGALAPAADERVALPLYACMVGVTAAGRVLSDSHWVSDTVAGAALGFTVVCGLRQGDAAARSLLLGGGRGGGESRGRGEGRR